MDFSLQSALPDGPLQEKEYRRLFASMPQEQVQTVLISDDAENFRNRKLIVELAETCRLPTVAPWREFVELGGLIAYSIDLADIYRHAARQVDQVLKGTKPTDIPVEQPTKFELVINLKTARALGLTVSPALVARTDEVIE